MAGSNPSGAEATEGKESETMARKKKKRLKPPTTGEKAHVLIGDIPYPVECISHEEIAGGVEVLRLLEDVGDRDTITSDVATTFFGKGSLITARWTGERHITTGRRVFQMVDPREGFDLA